MIASRQFIRPLAPSGACTLRVPSPSGACIRWGSSSPPGSIVGRVASFVVREGFILSGIAGVAGGSIALAGYLAERNAEAKEDGEPPLFGRRVLLPDGRRLHVRDSRNSTSTASAAAKPPATSRNEEVSSNGTLLEAADPSRGVDNETLTVVFEAGRGETLLEWEPVLRQLEQSPTLRQARDKQRVRLVSYSRSGLGLSDAPPITSTALPFPLYGLRSAQGVGRTSDDVANDLVQLLTALQVHGPVVFVASGVGGLHARVAAHHLQSAAANSSEGNHKSNTNNNNNNNHPFLAGFVLVEPVAEGVSSAHKELVARHVGPEQAEASLGAGLQRAALMDACMAKIGITRMKVGVNKSAKRQADLLYGPPSSFGTAALSWTSRGPHRETAYRELVGWVHSEAQAASTTAPGGSSSQTSLAPATPAAGGGASVAQSSSAAASPLKTIHNGLPVALITRGKRGELFGAFDGSKKQGKQASGDQASQGQKLSEAMELEWDSGLRRLARSLSAFESTSNGSSSNGTTTVPTNDVVLAEIAGGGNKLPLFFPGEVAAAVEAVTEQALGNVAKPVKGPDARPSSRKSLRERLLAFKPGEATSSVASSGFELLDANTDVFQR